jgi:uncharacterized coiled-coil protein SlyX
MAWRETHCHRSSDPGLTLSHGPQCYAFRVKVNKANINFQNPKKINIGFAFLVFSLLLLSPLLPISFVVKMKLNRLSGRHSHYLKKIGEKNEIIRSLEKSISDALSKLYEASKAHDASIQSQNRFQGQLQELNSLLSSTESEEKKLSLDLAAVHQTLLLRSQDNRESEHRSVEMGHSQRVLKDCLAEMSFEMDCWEKRVKSLLVANEKKSRKQTKKNQEILRKEYDELGFIEEDSLKWQSRAEWLESSSAQKDDYIGQIDSLLTGRQGMISQLREQLAEAIRTKEDADAAVLEIQSLSTVEEARTETTNSFQDANGAVLEIQSLSTLEEARTETANFFQDAEQGIKLVFLELEALFGPGETTYSSPRPILQQLKQSLALILPPSTDEEGIADLLFDALQESMDMAFAKQIAYDHPNRPLDEIKPLPIPCSYLLKCCKKTLIDWARYSWDNGANFDKALKESVRKESAIYCSNKYHEAVVMTRYDAFQAVHDPAIPSP